MRNLDCPKNRTTQAKADRPRPLTQIGSLYVNITRYLLPLWARVGLSEDWVDSHLDIVSSIRDGDIEEASRLIVDQIAEASIRVRDVLRFLDNQQRE